jgi:hypothetical protein
MNGVMAWVEERREDNRHRFFQFLDAQRQIWTPSNIFNRCCVKWTADGNYSDDEFDEYSFRTGCHGPHHCRRDHPQITLSFDAESKVTTATISHRLDPFLAYFEARLANETAWPDPFLAYFEACLANETAWPQSETTYQLDGYLRQNMTDLHAQRFGSHLLKVAPGALEASDAAYVQEEQERKDTNTRATKRARIGSGGSTETFDRMEEAMDIAVLHRLQQDLEVDPLALHCMRQTSKMFHKTATAIAVRKIESLDLALTPLVDGMERHGDDKFDSYHDACFVSDPMGEYIVAYTMRDKVPLVFKKEDGKEGAFEPAAGTRADEFIWHSTLLEDSSRYECSSEGVLDCADDYSGQLMRVYWHPGNDDLVTPPERIGNYGQPLPSLGVLLAELDVEYNPEKGTTTERRNGVCLEYAVLESSREEYVGEDADESYYGDDGDDENNSHGDDCDERRQQEKRVYITYKGKIKIKKVNVDFGVLVKAHAIQLFRKLKRANAQIEKERPLTEKEKNYALLVRATSDL